MPRIERPATLNLRSYVATLRRLAPELGAASFAVAGGTAAFAGIGSPLSTVKGTGPRISTQDLQEVESFFHRHGAPAVTIEVAPWLTETSRPMLGDRGYGLAGHEDVVATTSVVPFSEKPRGVGIIPTEASSQVMRLSYELPDDSGSKHLTAAAANLDNAQLHGVRDNHRWVACGQSVVYGDIAIFGCDGTLPEARGRGAQTALIEQRLQGLTPGMIAVAEVAPGSGSERNYLRCGFRVAYARTHYVRSLL